MVGSHEYSSSWLTTAVCPYWAAQWSAVSLSFVCNKWSPCRIFYLNFKHTKNKTRGITANIHAQTLEVSDQHVCRSRSKVTIERVALLLRLWEILSSRLDNDNLRAYPETLYGFTQSLKQDGALNQATTASFHIFTIHHSLMILSFDAV